MGAVLCNVVPLQIVADAEQQMVARDRRVNLMYRVRVRQVHYSCGDFTLNDVRETFPNVTPVPDRSLESDTSNTHRRASELAD